MYEIDVECVYVCVCGVCAGRDVSKTMNSTMGEIDLGMGTCIIVYIILL